MIGKGVFSGCTCLETVVLPEIITSFDTMTAFYGCRNLHKITIPKGITKIGMNAFKDCDRLSSVNIPEGVIRIQRFAFDGCLSLQSLTLPKSLAFIEDYVFGNCNSLESLVLLPLDPPQLSVYSYLPAKVCIYVPSERLDAYKTSGGWSAYAIQAIPE